MRFRLGLCQMKGFMEKNKSMEKAEKFVKEAVKKGAKVVSLPEMWNCPYDNKYFREYAEVETGRTPSFLQQLAYEEKIYLIGGSIPELDKDKVYNTSYIFSPRGERLGKHRKAHLFDVDIKNGIRFMESDTLTPGNRATIVETEYGKIGVAICYDVRFPELSKKMVKEGADLIVLPAAFNMITGPAHWQLTMRARALDNQVYFAANAPARDEEGPYVAYGHSMIVDPWGKILKECDEKEHIIVEEIDTEYLKEIRDQLPLLKHKREELYR